MLMRVACGACRRPDARFGVKPLSRIRSQRVGNHRVHRSAVNPGADEAVRALFCRAVAGSALLLGAIVGDVSVAVAQEPMSFPAPIELPAVSPLPGAGGTSVPMIQPIFPGSERGSGRERASALGPNGRHGQGRTPELTGLHATAALQPAVLQVRVAHSLAAYESQPEPSQSRAVSARLTELMDLRSLGYHPGVESAWSSTLSHALQVLEQPSGASGQPMWDASQQDLHAVLDGALSQAANVSETREFRRRLRLAEIRDSVSRGDIDATIRLGQRYLALHEVDAEVQREVLAARWADVQRIADVRGWNSDTLEQIWHQTVMLEGTMYAELSIERLLQALERELLVLTASDLDRLTRSMQRLGATSPRLGSRNVLGRVHYLAALRVWRMADEQPDADAIRQINLHVLRATQAGYMADPEGMIGTMHVRSAGPLLLPLVVLLPLLLLPLRRSRWLRRRVAKGAYARALRERRLGQIDESATWLAAVTEYLRTTEPLDTEETLLLADSCVRLMRDAMDRARPQEARMWADRIQDLHPEYWQDGYERLAQRLGMTMQSSGATP